MIFPHAHSVIEWSEAEMLRTWRRPAQLVCDFNNLQFASVMALVLFVALLIFMADTRPHHRLYVDLPKVHHPVSMASADREDAIRLTITRDGKIYFGSDQLIGSDAVKEKVLERLQDRTVERKVYVVADMRARWGTVKHALDGVRSAGILRVAFLVR